MPSKPTGGKGSNQYRTRPVGGAGVRADTQDLHTQITNEDMDEEKVAWIFGSPEAADWTREGFPAGPAYDAQRAGITVHDALEWRDGGRVSDLDEMRGWVASGWHPSVVREWKDVRGVTTPEHTVRLTAVFGSAGPAITWSSRFHNYAAARQATDTSRWLDWAETGVDPHVAARYAVQGDDPAEVKAAWEEAGFALDDRSRWSRQMEPADAARYRDVGFSSDSAFHARLYLDDGIEPDEAWRWHRGLWCDGPRVRERWLEAGFEDPDEAQVWFDAEFSPSAAQRAVAAGYGSPKAVLAAHPTLRN